MSLPDSIRPVVCWFFALILIIMPISCNESNLELPDGLYAVISTRRGKITVELFPEQSPLTVTNFVGLTEGTLDFANRNGPYYDGILFHRVIDDFMIQGGDPSGTGSGGPGYQFFDETGNGLIFDKPGLLAMANAGPNTNGSQFFITHVPTNWLNGKHTIFGQVVEGQDVVDAIRQEDRIRNIKILRIGSQVQDFKADTEAFRQLEMEITTRQEEEIEENLLQVISDWESQGFETSQNEETGIYFAVTQPGSGTPPPPGTLVSVHYIGTLLNGQKFDSSRDRGEPFTFNLGAGQVIPGWDLTLLQMRKGERRLVILPPEMGYGQRGAGPIPPNSHLVFDIELLDF